MTNEKDDEKNGYIKIRNELVYVSNFVRWLSSKWLTKKISF